MRNTMINVLVFAAGAAIGSLVTWKFVKTRYERIAQEEIDSVKETWARLSQEESNDSACQESKETDSNIVTDEARQYENIARRYAPSSDNDGEGGGDDEVAYINGPYVITPDDFGDGNFDHDLYCLTYYSDGVLADDWYIKHDIDESIGEDALKHFGDYTEDVVHVRNERLRRDYEVVKDCRTYKEVVAANPLAHMHAT